MGEAARDDCSPRLRVRDGVARTLRCCAASSLPFSIVNGISMEPLDPRIFFGSSLTLCRYHTSKS